MRDSKRFYSSIFEVAKEYFHCDLVAFSRVDKEANQYVHWFLSSHSLEADTFRSPFNPGTFCNRVVTSQELFTVNSLASGPASITCPMMVAEGFDSYMGAPIFNSGECIGAFEVFCINARVWSQEEKKMALKCATIVETLVKTGHVELSALQA